MFFTPYLDRSIVYIHADRWSLVAEDHGFMNTTRNTNSIPAKMTKVTTSPQAFQRLAIIGPTRNTVYRSHKTVKPKTAPSIRLVTMKPSRGISGVESNLRLSELVREASKLTVSVLPDFYFDRIIRIPSLEKLFNETRAKAAAGGGNLRGYSQNELPGGNATNLAFALASLSINTRLYCVGDASVRGLLQETPNCEITLIEGRPSFTAALEFPFRGRTVNVMISDVGDVAGFDGRKLSRTDLRGLGESDCVALTNWSSNKSGNTLARRVFSLAGRRHRLNFLDPADFTGAENRLMQLKNIVDEGLIDVLSLNENEARILAGRLSVQRLPHEYEPGDVVRASAILHSKLSATIDIHTPFGSASASDEGHVWAATPRLVSGLVTGAGDVWDAGDILGHLLRFEPHARLVFANLCAYAYIKTEKQPRLKGMRHFLS